MSIFPFVLIALCYCKPDDAPKSVPSASLCVKTDDGIDLKLIAIPSGTFEMGRDISIAERTWMTIDLLTDRLDEGRNAM